MPSGGWRERFRAENCKNRYFLNLLEGWTRFAFQKKKKIYLVACGCLETVNKFGVFFVFLKKKPSLYPAYIFPHSIPPPKTAFEILWQNCLVSIFDLCTVIDPLNHWAIIEPEQGIKEGWANHSLWINAQKFPQVRFFFLLFFNWKPPFSLKLKHSEERISVYCYL